MSDMPTSPVSEPGIEHVFGDRVSDASHAAPAPTLGGEWRRLGAFLKRPTLAVSGQDDAPLLVIGRIYALDVLVMLALVAAASIAVALGVYLPETALAGIEFTPTVIALVVIGAPVLEEFVFRSWLSGKPQHILALLAVGAGLVGFGLAHTSGVLVGFAILVAAFIGAVLALFLLRGRPPMRWFAVIFPALFWAATVSFALVHLFNFEEGSLAILLPLVLPQLALGALVGYLRVRIGLWAAILLHALHNGTALSIAALAMALS